VLPNASRRRPRTAAAAIYSACADASPQRHRHYRSTPAGSQSATAPLSDESRQPDAATQSLHRCSAGRHLLYLPEPSSPRQDFFPKPPLPPAARAPRARPLHRLSRPINRRAAPCCTPHLPSHFLLPPLPCSAANIAGHLPPLFLRRGKSPSSISLSEPPLPKVSPG
jgi:hypothetical protein